MPYFCTALKRIALFIFVLLSFCISSAAQDGHSSLLSDFSLFSKKSNYKDTVWIVTGPKALDNKFKKWKFDFVFDARQTIISSTVARLGGIRIGMEYRRVHRFGIGFYGLGDGIIVNSLQEISPLITRANLNLSYTSLFYERVLYFHPKWEVSATAHIGTGRITGSYTTETGQTRTLPDLNVKPFEISTTCYYNLNWWISVGGGVGYRYMRKTPPEVRPIYNAPVAILRVRIKFGKLTKSIWNHDIKYTY